MSEVTSEITPTPGQFLSSGVRCRGWFYSPVKATSRGCVVMAHGFGASPDGPLGQVARRIAAAGTAAFAFDYRRFGASEGEPRERLDMDSQLDDWHAAIAHVRERDDIDPDLIGLWGSSLSGGQVLCVAACDHRIASVVAQVPYTDGHSLARAAGLRHLIRLTPAIARDALHNVTGRDPYMISGLGPPGKAAAVTTRVADNYDSLVAGAPSWPNRVNAGAMLQVYRFRPAALAQQIRCPLLVVLSYRDHVAPADAAMRAAHGLPYIELALFPALHFELYGGETFERAMRTEISFFTHHFARQDNGLRAQMSPEQRPHRQASARRRTGRMLRGAWRLGRSSGFAASE
jgi:dienelactone hydrolase